ncbi:hypothetical protein CC77DRAFT_1073389 [Alternaria alternata]|uniref:Uncharacterized protein n=2 Tax=Alternaria sect. Alternaria TaxID=2499237 RepID=A0A177DI11_ALTAL|nr:hypothetical protein CC77DRAFT_1073389 [Alternaria alternata]OAG18469.1 hypothetical protein CC77DRAFT_1073389 [Alternaria alternata]
MGKQKTVVSDKRPRHPRGSTKGGGGRRGRPKGRPSQSATPTPGTSQNGASQKLMVKVNMGLDPPSPHSHATLPHDGHRDQDDGFPQQLAQPAPVTTRTGRAIQKPQQYDAIQGSDIDLFIDQNSEDHGDDDRMFLTSDPPYVSHKAQEHLQQPPKTRGRPPKNNTSFGASVVKVNEESAESPFLQNLPVPSFPADPAQFVADADVYAILDALYSTTRTFIDLPSFSNASDPDHAQPYSAKALTQLYVLCYRKQRWNLCDMISDTWIRAFHDMRKKDQQKPQTQTWRPNPALDRRKRKAQEALAKGHYIPSEFDADPKKYGLVVTDPELEKDVTWINTDLLNLLYKFTSPGCGARFLWADALALFGDKAEEVIGEMTREGFELHPDLLFNIMQTSLRMCRRNLTLKIEESTEGAWCKRYHEHGKNGQRCYRELASKNGEAEGGLRDTSLNVREMRGSIDQDLLDRFGEGLEDEQGTAEAIRGEKRGPVESGNFGLNKRTTWNGEEEDAEGVSEDE